MIHYTTVYLCPEHGGYEAVEAICVNCEDIGWIETDDEH